MYVFLSDVKKIFNSVGRFSSVSSSSSAVGGRQHLDELEGGMELGIELGEEMDEEQEAHLSPAYRSKYRQDTIHMTNQLIYDTTRK